MPVRHAHLILYVDDQEASSRFYRNVLETEPTLDVPGMTEFSLRETCTLGLMPIARDSPTAARTAPEWLWSSG